MSPGETGSLSRRTFLRGAGACLALPLLPSLRPRALWAEPPAAPLRMAFLFVPNGKHMPDWTPATEGADYEQPWILEPLAAHRDHFQVLSGLGQDAAYAHGDGPGDHARSGAVFLTCQHPRKTAGADIRVGVSIDQLAARHLGNETRLPSLEIGCDGGAQSGSCDSGYSCAYSSNLSWRNPTTPAPKERNPRLVFERLFTDGDSNETAEARARRLANRKSILDFVTDDAARLRRRVGSADGDKIEQYLDSVREIERRIERAEGGADAAQDDLRMAAPKGIPGSYEEHIRLLGDLMVLAFRTDSTRICSFMVANAGSGRSYKSLGVPQGHHGLSHHGGDTDKQERIRKINRFHVTQLAYVLGELRAVKEGEGTLLDNTMLVYGSGIGDGNRHNHNDLPVILAGGGGGAFGGGRHVQYEKGTPMANLYLTMLGHAGVQAKTFGDSTGKLEGLA